MRVYALTHLSDTALTRDLAAAIASERGATAAVLAHIAEFDARRLYLPAGYTSMFAYCVEKLHLSGDATFKRTQAARAARRFPAIFAASADGRLHLSAVVLLAPHLTTGNATELLEAASHRTKSEVEALLARRFPKPELAPLVRALPIAGAPCDDLPAPGQVIMSTRPAPEPVVMSTQAAPGQVGAGFSEAAGSSGNTVVPEPVAAPAPRSKVAPVAAERFAVQLTIGKATHEKLRHAQALLSHKVPSGDLATVLDLALDALIGRLEKQKLARTDQPRPRRRGSASNPRHVPARVRRAVWARDQGRCTFVGEDGHRCGARRFLQFDHVDPVARGGEATVAGVRLRCRSHNQYEAERVFGAGFMQAKREAAQRAAEARRATTGSACDARAEARLSNVTQDAKAEAALPGADRVRPGDAALTRPVLRRPQRVTNEPSASG